jgi:hypothetical protein
MKASNCARASIVSDRTPFTARIAALIGAMADASSGSSGCIAMKGLAALSSVERCMYRDDAISGPSQGPEFIDAPVDCPLPRFRQWRDAGQQMPNDADWLRSRQGRQLKRVALLDVAVAPLATAVQS